MRLALKKKLLNITLLASLVIVLPGWQAGESVAAPLTINVPETYKSAFTLAGRASVSVTFEPAVPMILEFDLTATPDVGWTFSLTNSNGVALIDADMDGDFETNGQVVSPYTVVVHASSPASLPGVGYTKVDFRAYSKINPADSSPVVKLQFAVPPSFVYAMSDSAELMRLAYLSPDARIEAPELLTTGGINLAVSAAVINNSRYILAWENDLNTTSLQSRNVEFSIYNKVGGALFNRIKPFDNAGTNNEGNGIIDSVPVLAASASGNFGMTFLRNFSNTPTKEIKFQLFNQDGNKLGALRTLTSSATVEVLSPQLAATAPFIENNTTISQFIASWEDGDGKIWASRLDANNGSLLETKLVADTHNLDDAKIPLLASLSDSRTFIAYSPISDTIKLNDINNHLVLDLNPGITISDTIATYRDAVQFNDNRILFVWVDYDLLGEVTQLKFTITDPSVDIQLTDTGQPKTLASPKGLSPASVSVELDPKNKDQAMVFWWSAYSPGNPQFIGEFLNFALIDSDGNEVIPPMIFRESGPTNNFTINPNGQGIVGLDGLFAQFMPSINK